MAMYHLQKAFENSLRTTSYERPPTANGTNLKPEIHRGCTGKAHACGTLKNKKVSPQKQSHPHRKNSVSSETISDSGSEGSSFNSNSNESNSTVKSSSQKSESRSQTPSRRKTTEVLMPTKDETDKARPRLLSDGDDHLIVPQTRRELLGPFQRSSSFRVKRPSPSPSPVRPPWNSNLGRKDFSPLTKVEVCSKTFSRNGFNSKNRGSFRRYNDGVNWLNLWEQSLTQRVDGACFKALDKLLESKVI